MFATLRRTRLARSLLLGLLAVLAFASTAAAQERIVGGSPVTHPWPAQAKVLISFGAEGSGLCGGTLVDRNWVLTAAHCVTNEDGSLIGASAFSATLGSSKLNPGEGEATTHQVSQVVRHPSYDHSTYNNDVALLRLSTPSSQPPMGIVSSDVLDLVTPGAMVRVIGWGTTSAGGDVSPDLLQVDVPVVSDADCGAATSYGSSLIAATMLCAGAEGTDSCQGDSGGPLMVNTGNGNDTSAEQWKVVGVVSWGNGCAEAQYPGIYAELGNIDLRSWIYENITGLPVGLQNSSFESDLDGASNWQTAVYDATGEVVRSGAGSCPADLDEAEAKRRLCRVGTDAFSVTDSGGTRDVSVTPLDGSSMLRLGGPFNDSSQAQSLDRYVAKQTFIVDPANPVVQLNYNMQTFDYSGYDEVRVRVRAFDGEGDVVYNKVVGGYGHGTNFKSTGWRGVEIDLSPLAGEPVTLRLDSGGTSDMLYAFWMYIDAGDAPHVDMPAPTLPETTPTGEQLAWSTQTDGNGLPVINIPNSQVSQFGACPGPSDPSPLYVKFPVPITPGNSTVSNVSVLFDGDNQTVTMEDPDTNDEWTMVGDGICITPFLNGTFYVSYTLTENGVSQAFVVPIGGLTLIDPQGIVYDKAVFDAAKAAGKTDEEARAQAAIGGATATLQRRVGDTDAFQTVLSGDPGITPNINPQTTPDSGPAKGLYQWDVAAGDYRVLVSKAGYVSATSPTVTIPPPVLDLHIPLERVRADAGFTSAPSAPQVGQTVTVTSSSTHPNGPSAISSTKWDLDNDGAFDDATGNSATTTFASAGAKTVRIEVTDDDGDVSVASGTVNVTTRKVPAAAFDVAGTLLAGVQLTFTSTSTHPDGAGKLTARWDFDNDGTVDATGASVTHTYATPGTRTVKLVVTDDDGDSGTATKDVAIAAPVVNPPAGLLPVIQPPVTKPAGKPCAGLKGAKLAKCKVAQKRKAALRKCKKLKGKKKAACIKKARAIGKKKRS